MHSEKAQSSSRIAINMARGECHQFVDLLACAIEAHRMVIQMLVLVERQNTVAAIDLTTRGTHQFFNIVVPVPLQYMSNSDEIALDVSRMVLQGIANASLGREIHHHFRLFFGKKRHQRTFIFQCQTVNSPDSRRGRRFDFTHPGLFEAGVVQVVKADISVTALQHRTNQNAMPLEHNVEE